MTNKTTNKPILVDSVIAAQNLDKNRFVNFAGGYCTTGQKALGVVNAETNAGQYAPININGILLIEAGAAIPQGSPIASDNNGRAIVQADNAQPNGFALDAATAIGDVIRLVRGI